jgi:hypothetical protein
LVDEAWKQLEKVNKDFFPGHMGGGLVYGLIINSVKMALYGYMLNRLGTAPSVAFLYNKPGVQQTQDLSKN